MQNPQPHRFNTINSRALAVSLARIPAPTYCFSLMLCTCKSTDGATYPCHGGQIAWCQIHTMASKSQNVHILTAHIHFKIQRSFRFLFATHARMIRESAVWTTCKQLLDHSMTLNCAVNRGGTQWVTLNCAVNRGSSGGTRWVKCSVQA